MTSLLTNGIDFSTRSAVSSAPVETSRAHILTVALEDYYQVGAFNQLIQRGQWYRFESRLERNTEQALDLLDRHNIKATFFVLGWIGDHFPELVRKVAERGHEIASKGYYHRSVRGMTPSELRDDLSKAREALESAAGTRVLGYRMADGWFAPDDLWALNVLAEEGYAYDSSIAPRWREFAHEPWRRFQHEHKHGDKTLWELPVSSVRLWRWVLPIGGGNYFRQFPHWFIRRAVRRWDQVYQAPFVMYFHVWELDPEQPRISSAGFLTRVRHYRNLHRMQGMLEHYFQNYSFSSAARYLKLDTRLATPPAPVRRQPEVIQPLDEDEDPSRPRKPLTYVIPCYNEELILPYLANTLKSVRADLGKDYQLHFVFVNDGSKDGTAEALQRNFGDWPRCQIVHHETNRGVTAGIMTGIRHAKTDLVCSIDCDCTYDPHEVAKMVALMTDDVDVVTASPYHPQGHVRNVPGWRLFLSKSSSWLYRRVLPQKLYTYTSCFRLYRRNAILNLKVKNNGFLGVAEILGKMILQGSKVVEYPAVLEVRMLGRSKMKTVRTIFGHLKLMTRLLWNRIWNRSSGESTELTNGGCLTPVADAPVSPQTEVTKCLTP